MKLSQQQFWGGTAAVVMVLLVILVWKSAVQDPVAKPNRPVRPTAGTKSISPASNTQSVEFPSLGPILGYKSSPELEEPNIAKYTPETFVLDADGNFLYLRNRTPHFKSKQRFDLMEKFFADKFAEKAERRRENGEPVTGGAFRILGTAKLSFSDPVVRNMVVREGSRAPWDAEVWGIHIQTTTDGEADALLVSMTMGKFRHSFYLKERLTREWLLMYPDIHSEDGNWHRTIIQIDEEWEESPPDAVTIDGIGPPVDGK